MILKNITKNKREQIGHLLFGPPYLPSMLLITKDKNKNKKDL